MRGERSCCFLLWFFFPVFTNVAFKLILFSVLPGVGPEKSGGKAEPCRGACRKELCLPGDLSAAPVFALESGPQTLGQDAVEGRGLSPSPHRTAHTCFVPRAPSGPHESW